MCIYVYIYIYIYIRIYTYTYICIYTYINGTVIRNSSNANHANYNVDNTSHDANTNNNTDAYAVII